MEQYSKKQVRDLLSDCFADVEAAIFAGLKSGRVDRDKLLSELDVLTKAQERLDARLTDDPNGSS